MDGIQPVGEDIKVPDMLGRLSSILGIRQQQQALQGQAAVVQQEQLKAEGQQGVNDFFQNHDFSKDTGPDGLTNPDLSMQSKDYQDLPGIAKPLVMQSLQGMRQRQLQNAQSFQNLNNDTLTQATQIIGGLANDPDVKTDTPAGRQKLDAAFGAIRQMTPQAAALANIYQPMVDHAKPGQLLGAVQAFQLQGANAATQRQQQNPQLANVNTGGATNIYNVQPEQGLQPGQQPVQRVPNTLPPQIINQPITGAPAVVGGAGGSTPRPLGGPPAATRSPTAPNAWSPYAGESSDIANNQNEVRQIRIQGDQAPLVHNINEKILQLSADANTGPGTAAWQNALGALGAPFGLSPTASYQEIGKFLEKNAINNMQAMGGPPSDARLSAAAAANGSQTFSPQALQAVTKFNDATVTGLAAYRRGVDNYVGTRNPDYTKLADFKSAWAKNFDVNVFLAENAFHNHDTAELTQLRQQLGPAGFKALAAKRKGLMSLEDGELPP